MNELLRPQTIRVCAIGTTLSRCSLVSWLTWESKVPPSPFEVPAGALEGAAGRGILGFIVHVLPRRVESCAVGRVGEALYLSSD